MTFLPDGITERDELSNGLHDFGRTTDRACASTNALGVSATSFARVMSKAFADATTGGKKFDDVLRHLALRLSDMAVTQAFQPLARNFASGFGNLFGGVQLNGLTAFAAGGVISAPAYFPLGPGGLGVAGEAGPEAILPLARGRDGRLGAATTVSVHIVTPDVESFRRSDAYIAGQIARAVARGQRSL